MGPSNDAGDSSDSSGSWRHDQTQTGVHLADGSVRALGEVSGAGRNWAWYEEIPVDPVNVQLAIPELGSAPDTETVDVGAAPPVPEGPSPRSLLRACAATGPSTSNGCVNKYAGHETRKTCIPDGHCPWTLAAVVQRRCRPPPPKPSGCSVWPGLVRSVSSMGRPATSSRCRR